MEVKRLNTFEDLGLSDLPKVTLETCAGAEYWIYSTETTVQHHIYKTGKNVLAAAPQGAYHFSAALMETFGNICLISSLARWIYPWLYLLITLQGVFFKKKEKKPTYPLPCNGNTLWIKSLLTTFFIISDLVFYGEMNRSTILLGHDAILSFPIINANSKGTQPPCSSSTTPIIFS